MIAQLWKRTPLATKFGVVVAIVGWFVSLGGGSSTTVNGEVTECSGLDVGPLAMGLLAVILASVGWKKVADAHERLKPPRQAFVVVSTLVAAGGVALLVKFGLDPDGKFC